MDGDNSGNGSNSIVPWGGFSWFHDGFKHTVHHPRHQRVAVWLDRAMVLVAILVCVSIFLQASLIINNKSSENVSMPSYILLVIASLIWMCYGITWNDGLISLSGLVASAGSIFALVASVSYRPNRNPGAFSSI